MERFDAVVIGAGEAGSLVASRAVESGYRVALTYRAHLGAPASTPDASRASS